MAFTKTIQPDWRQRVTELFDGELNLDSLDLSNFDMENQEVVDQAFMDDLQQAIGEAVEARNLGLSYLHSSQGWRTLSVDPNIQKLIGTDLNTVQARQFCMYWELDVMIDPISGRMEVTDWAEDKPELFQELALLNQIWHTTSDVSEEFVIQPMSALVDAFTSQFISQEVVYLGYIPLPSGEPPVTAAMLESALKKCCDLKLIDLRTVKYSAGQKAFYTEDGVEIASLVIDRSWKQVFDEVEGLVLNENFTDFYPPTAAYISNDDRFWRYVYDAAVLEKSDVISEVRGRPKAEWERHYKVGVINGELHSVMAFENGKVVPILCPTEEIVEEL